MKIKIWGCRGSLPAPHTPGHMQERFAAVISGFLDAGQNHKDQIGPYLKRQNPGETFGFGGNTTCVEVQQGSSQIIIDGGSGIRLSGYDLLRGPCGKGKGEVHILMTHFHWDHLIGLPFFTPIFIPGNTIHFYAVQPDLEQIIRSMFKKPYFPVNFEQLGAKIVFHKLEPRKQFKLGELAITPYQLDHPDPSWGFRVEGGGKIYSHCVDSECTRFSPEEIGLDLPLYQNVDLMLFDAQYTLMEAIEKVNWGHGSSNIGIDLAIREKVKKVIFFHHDPASNDQKIAQIEAQTRRYYESQLKHLKRAGQNPHELVWEFAIEGREYEV